MRKIKWEGLEIGFSRIKVMYDMKISEDVRDDVVYTAVFDLI